MTRLSHVAAFYDAIRTRSSSSTAIILSLAFDPTSSYLASATSASHLTIHSLRAAASRPLGIPPAAHTNATTLATFPLPSHGAINALVTIAATATLVIATNTALLSAHWPSLLASAVNTAHSASDFSADGDGNVPGDGLFVTLVKGMRFNAITTLPGSDTVVAAADNGALFRIDQRTETVTAFSAALHRNSFPHCIASSPIDRNTLFIGCNDNTVRQFDLRRNKGIANRFTPPHLPNTRSPNPYIPCLATHPSGEYLLYGVSTGAIVSHHIATGEIDSTSPTSYRPQALVYCNGSFYAGGSYDIWDTIPNFTPRKDVFPVVGSGDAIPPARKRCRLPADAHRAADGGLQTFDVAARLSQTAPLTPTSVYALAVSSRGTLAAGGFTAFESGAVGGDLCTSDGYRRNYIDVYTSPPLRSFIIAL